MKKECVLFFMCVATMLVARAQTATETILLNFTEYPGGAGPVGTLTMDASGNFYGTTYTGGGVSQAGIVFKYSTAGKYSVVGVSSAPREHEFHRCGYPLPVH